MSNAMEKEEVEEGAEEEDVSLRTDPRGTRTTESRRIGFATGAVTGSGVEGEDEEDEFVEER